MDRRMFVGALGAAGLASAMPGLDPLFALSAADKIDKIGLQLYTIRGLMKESVERTLKEVADIGYKEVEFHDYFGRPPRAIRQLLDRNGLKSPACHVSLETLGAGWHSRLNDASEVGHKWLLVAYLGEKDRNSLEAVKRTAEAFNKAGKDAKNYRMRFGYHNHDFEFKEIEGRRIYDVLLEETDPEYVDFEMDLYWATKAGVSPLDYFAKYPGRFPMVHVKDAGPPPDLKMTEVGKGTIKWADIFAQEKLAGIKHYFVEHDNPSDPMASIKTSYRYLKELRF
jgi:sugar phosphate isomerase/epimerase